MKTYYKSGQIIDHTPSSAVSSGDIVTIGYGLIGIAVNDIAAGATGPVLVQGEVTVTKASGQAWTDGQRVYYDASNDNFTTTVTSYPAGVAVGAAASSATSAKILLNVLNPVMRTVEIADPGDGGAIPVTASGVCPLVSAGAETRTLAAPSFAGQRLTLAMKTDGGDITLTCATGLNTTGNNTAVFNDAGDILVLEAIEVGSNLRWRVIANDTVALSTV